MKWKNGKKTEKKGNYTKKKELSYIKKRTQHDNILKLGEKTETKKWVKEKLQRKEEIRVRNKENMN